MLYISSKINDLNSQVLSTSVFLERITTSKKTRGHRNRVIHTIPVIPK